MVCKISRAVFKTK